MYEELAIRIEMFGDEIEKITSLHPLTGEIIRDESQTHIFPATHYAAGPETIKRAIGDIQDELQIQLTLFEKQGFIGCQDKGRALKLFYEPGGSRRFASSRCSK